MTEWPEPADFMQWLDCMHRQSTLAVVRAKYPSFSQQDLEDVWAETRKDLLMLWPDKIHEGRGLGSLVGLIARRRACDHFRRINKQKKLIRVEAEEVQARTTSGEKGGAGRWERLSPLEREELKNQTNEAFRLLSPDEWLVLAVYCEHYPKIRSPKQLLEQLRDEFPEVRHKAWTPADVKRLLDQARTIVHTYLCRKGYHVDFGT